MTVRVLRSPAETRNPQVVELERTPGETNEQWLRRAIDGRRVETGKEWSLLLSGGDLAGGHLVARLLPEHAGRARHQGRVLRQARPGPRRDVRGLGAHRDGGAAGGPQASDEAAPEVMDAAW
jgi:hypothetical protein